MNFSLFDPPDPVSLIEVRPVIDHTVRALCLKPYPLHPKGCPNFGKGDRRCPPQAPLFDDEFDLTYPVYAVVNEFDLAGHVGRMRAKNPSWSERQLQCVLYWQGTARKQLNAKIDQAIAMESCRGYAATWCPEGMGVDVTSTLADAGIMLEWPPVNITRQVAFLAKPKRGNRP